MKRQSAIGAAAAKRHGVMFDYGDGQSNGTVLDTNRWVTQGTTANGGTATYQSSGLQFSTGTGNGGTDRITRNFNVGSRTDVEVTGTFTHAATGTAFPLICARATTSTVDYSNGYTMLLSRNSSWVVQKVVSFSGTTLATVVRTISASTTYGFRFQVVGTALRAKVWTGTEPSSWDVDITDSTFSSAGVCGISVGTGAAGTNSVTFDDITVSSP